VAIYQGSDGTQNKRSQIDLETVIGSTSQGKPHWGGQGSWSRFADGASISKEHYLLTGDGDEIDLALHVTMQDGKIKAKLPLNAQLAKMCSEADWMEFKVVTSPNQTKFKSFVDLLGQASSFALKQTETSQDLKIVDDQETSRFKSSLRKTMNSTISSQVSSIVTTHIETTLKKAIEAAIETVQTEITNTVEESKKDILEAAEKEVMEQCDQFVLKAVQHATTNRMSKYQESMTTMMKTIIDVQLAEAQSNLFSLLMNQTA
jgi:hypothetical protein